LTTTRAQFGAVWFPLGSYAAMQNFKPFFTFAGTCHDTELAALAATVTPDAVFDDSGKTRERTDGVPHLGRHGRAERERPLRDYADGQPRSDQSR